MVFDLAFNFVVPLPFRVVLLVQLGIHLWYSLVWYCYKIHKINVLALLNLSYSPYKYSLSDHTSESANAELATSSEADSGENQLLLNGIYSKIKKTLFSNLTGLLSFWTFRLIFHDYPFLVNIVECILPLVLLGYTLTRFFENGETMGQSRMHSTMKRILLGNINSATMRTNDILISDTLTSYSRVFNDFGACIWLLVGSTSSNYNVELEALLLAFPGLIRIRQCWYEYRLTKQKQHFFNLVKYSAGLGPIIVNLLIKVKMAQMSEEVDVSSELNSLNKWWYVCATISSAYLFIWDVRMDWGFGLFEPLFMTGTDFTPLRAPNMLVYNNIVAYYSVIVIDFVLRFLWVFKIFVIKETEVELGLGNQVGNFLFGYDYTLFGFVLVEVLELLRRWLWCFLKLESDLVKLQRNGIPMVAMKTSRP